MLNFMENISSEKRVLLTKVDYSIANRELQNRINLQIGDKFSILNESVEGFSIEFSREIMPLEQQEGFTIEVAYEVDFKYVTPISENAVKIDATELEECIKKDPGFFTEGCMAKASILISQISAFLVSGSDSLIVTPPELIIE